MQNSIIIAVVVVLLLGGTYLFTQSDDNIVLTQDTMTTPPTTNSSPNLNEPAAELPTVVGIAVATPETATLVAAVTAGNLVDTLSGPGPFTVFAPVNDAFAALPAGTVDNLLLPENVADLQAILTYHLVPGVYTASMVTDGLTLTTVQGQELTFNLVDGKVRINNTSTVVMADVMASNGVVHVIDAVLLPEAGV